MVGHKPFVGRRIELVELSRQLDRARELVPGLVVIEGPAGIGKTALLNHFLKNVEDVEVLRASGDESEADLTFGVLDQWVPPALVRDGDRRAGSHNGDEGDTLVAIDPLTAGSRLLEVVSESERTRPVIVALDDAHWADRPSLQALTFAIRRLSEDRVLVIVTLRDEPDFALPEAFARLLGGENVSRLPLSGLAAGDLRRLGAEVTGEALSPRAAARLRDHTAGNPLHARALLEQLPADVLRKTDEPLPAPRSFEVLVRRRLAACRPETRRFVGAASVLGTRCALHVVSELSEVDDPLRALDDASDAGLLDETSSGRMVEFPHPLLRAAVYQQLRATERTRLHRRAAESLDDARTRLRHRLYAATGPDDELAEDLAAFARRRISVGDSTAACELLEAAAGLATEASNREQFAVEAIDCDLTTGNVPELGETSERLRGFRRTVWRDYVLARLAVVAGHLDEAEPLLLGAWRRCDVETDSELAARIAGQLAWLHVARDRGRDAVEWSERALRFGGESGTSDLGQLIHVMSLEMTGRVEERLAPLSDLPNPTVASAVELDALLGRARLRSRNDDLVGAYRDLQGIVGAAPGRSVTFQVMASLMLGKVQYLMGRWDDAETHASLAASLAVDAEQGWLAPICHAVASFVPSARGAWDQASDNLERAERRAVYPARSIAVIYFASARAHFAAARNDTLGVIDALQPLLARAPDSAAFFEPGLIMRWQDLLVEALALEGRHAEADAVLEPFETRAAEHRRRSAMAAAARARGTLLAARQDLDRAMAAFDHGLELASTLPMPFDRARLQLAAGSCLRRAGQRRAAAVHLQNASATFERLGARPYLERTDRELAACGRRHVGRPPTSEPTLTAQELAVARLAARGMTNKQIARELVISTKTVEYHLGHVYDKLHLSSRVQLAHRLGRD